MRFSKLVSWVLVSVGAFASNAPSTAGVDALVQRRLPQHADCFEFCITASSTNSSSKQDTYTVSSTDAGKILVEGSSVSAVLYGLHKYLSDVAHVDIWWYIGSQLDQAPLQLPTLEEPLTGSAVVPYRYHFNTVTTSYTGAFWSWDDWQLQLDWMALRGINLPLAWVGYEKIVIDVFREVGLNDDEIISFLSGPAFQAWNRFGNIQGSWGGSLPEVWVNDQFKMQLQIVERMVELGMTPVLPAFTGFVPQNISRVWPNANLKKSPRWETFPASYTNDTYLDPFDPHFEELQKSFISKQQAAYGNVTHIWTLDQFNENMPASGDLDYLHNVSHNTWSSLKAADPDAVWLMQGWLFAADSTFWTNPRVEAFLGGVLVDSDMLILDLFTETLPQWQRTNSFFGKPWIWCQLHDFGGNMGLYGQIENITINSTEAIANSSSLVGFGLTPEGQEGNEIMYDLLLDQAWSSTPIDTVTYFYDWVSARYGAGPDQNPQELYYAWEMVRETVYNNTNSSIQAVSKSILELAPALSSILGYPGHHPTVIAYDANILVEAWRELTAAANRTSSLWNNPAYQYDVVDWTRQVLANAFTPMYNNLVTAYNSSASTNDIKSAGTRLTDLLGTLDQILSTNEHFLLGTWIDAARASASNGSADFFEYNARNQITLWGPTGQIEDYASKQWGGLVGPYYQKRWQMFVDYLVVTPLSNYSHDAFHTQLLNWETTWVNQISQKQDTKVFSEKGKVDIRSTISSAVQQWSELF